jgi:single-stranded-DNA-specific exonuclease
LKAADPAALARLREARRWPDLSCRLLAARGIAGPAEAEAFLHFRLDQAHDPRLLSGMDAAVERLTRAYRLKERVGVLGDYDVDGVTSTVLLVKLFGLLGLPCSWLIPDRLRDGYGPNARILGELKQAGCATVVTVDCGISAVAEAQAAKELGLDLIITDHHVPGPSLPAALAVVNPKTSPSYPYDMLGGVGVAFKLAQALLTALEHPRKAEFLDHMLELVALGTICDVAPLDGENRALVREGLDRLRQARWMGLRALGDAASVKLSTADAGSVGFYLGPRLNAGGRVGDAGLGVRLLLSKDAEECKRLAAELDAMNRERQDLEKAVLVQAEEAAQAQIAAGAASLVLWSEDWHPGVVGLAASRLLERHGRPTFVFGVRDGVAKGSARSRKPFHLVEALQACSQHLKKFGGHEVAAGATVDPAELPAFRAAFDAQAQRLSAEDRRPVLTADLELPMAEAGESVLEQLAVFEPHGMKNPRPLFLARGLSVGSGSKRMGADGSHLRLNLAQKGQSAQAVAWRMGARLEELQAAGSVDVLYHLAWNEWNGRRSLQWELRDVRPSGQAVEQA